MDLNTTIDVLYMVGSISDVHSHIHSNTTPKGVLNKYTNYDIHELCALCVIIVKPAAFMLE